MIKISKGAKLIKFLLKDSDHTEEQLEDEFFLKDPDHTEERLEELREPVTNGIIEAAQDALIICDVLGILPPGWLLTAIDQHLTTLISLNPPSETKGAWGYTASRKSTRKRRTRFETVNRFRRKGKTLDESFKLASEELIGSQARGAAASIETDYWEVVAALKDRNVRGDYYANHQMSVLPRSVDKTNY